jgi:16S rRNA (guanine527-N7)-methyltransferase
LTPASLEALLERAGVESHLIEGLARYGALVLDANLRFNLTGAKSPEELVDHICDSLTVVPYLVEPYVDVGSGAGFPAIPASMAKGFPVTMIEATAKKAAFLRSALAALEVDGVVIAERAEIAARRPELRERFKSSTARALAAAPTVAEFLLPLLEPGGVAVLQRGSVDPSETIALEDASMMLGGRLETKKQLDGNRCLAILRKVGTTPDRFPRRPGIPAKRPLCRR